DEPGMRLGVERALAGFVVSLPDFDGDVSFTLDLAGTGEEALARIAAARPDILLLDHKLPGISGLEILEQILESKSEILTIMMTAYASLDTAITATKRGAYDFLAKPFTPTELKASVRKAVRHLLLQRQARKLAQEKRQVRFQFITVLAHELKAPLAAIEGYLNILEDKSLGPDLQPYQQMVARSLVRVDGMRKLILDLLDLTRIESGNRKREHVAVDVCQAAQTALDTVQPEAQARGIALHLQAPPHPTLSPGGRGKGEGVQLLGDPAEVEIMLNNLVSNAVKYNRDGGKVDVEITPRGNQVQIAVADTGIGLTPEEAGRLFHDFVRIKNEKTRNILGSGLGLSILKKLAQLYGGDISVSSKPGEGSVFTLVLKLDMPAESLAEKV
ncbi:MAG: ATP-binding protein, partial [Planctomycetota bacterium]